MDIGLLLFGATASLRGHFIYLGYVFRSGFAGLFGKYIVTLLRTYQAVFQRDCTILYSYQKCLNLLIFLYHIDVLSIFWILAILVGV